MKMIKILVTVLVGFAFAEIANLIGFAEMYSLLIALLVSAAFGETFEVSPKGDEKETFNVSEDKESGDIIFP